MTTYFRRLTLLAALALAWPALALAQIAPTQTTLAGAITDPAGTVMVVSSATGFALTDAPSGVQKFALIDKELVAIRSSANAGTVIAIVRGQGGTNGATHASGAVVTISGAPAFRTADTESAGRPTAGSCTSANEAYLPVYNVQNGRRWNCIGSTWMVDNGVAWIPGPACGGTAASALASVPLTVGTQGANGVVSIGTSGIPVIQVATTASAVNHTYQCPLSLVPSALTTGVSHQVSVIDATVIYGVLQTGLGTQLASGSLGAFNGNPVFTSQTLITPSSVAGGGGATIVGLQRADSGFLTITPNNPVGMGVGLGTTMPFIATTTNTAGMFYALKFAPASPFIMSTDQRTYYLTVSFLTTAALTTTHVAGVLVHYAYIPD